MSLEGQEPSASAPAQYSGADQHRADQHRADQHRADQHRADQDRTLLAMQQLEAVLGAAAPGREEAWRDDVRSALSILGQAAREEAQNAAQPDSLLSDVARTQPWLRNRVRGLRIHYRQLQDSIASLRSELEHPADPTVDFADIRQRFAWVLTALRHQRARESDLIYEAYYDAFRSDVARDVGDAPRRPEG
jgi:hypothetical protein